MERLKTCRITMLVVVMLLLTHETFSQYRTSNKLRNGIIPSVVRSRKPPAQNYLPTKSNLDKVTPTHVGSSYGGRRTDAHGNILGGSGRKRYHYQNFSTRKRAKDAARRNGASTPIYTPKEAKNRRAHFHAVDRKGNSKHKQPHFAY